MSAGISRREFVKKAGIGAGGLVVAGSAPASALARITVRERPSASNVIKIGFISPRTGPARKLRRARSVRLGLARKGLAKGVTIKGKHYAVKIYRQGQPVEPSTRGRSSRRPHQQDKVDLCCRRPRRRRTTPSPTPVRRPACRTSHHGPAVGSVVLRPRRQARQARPRSSGATTSASASAQFAKEYHHQLEERASRRTRRSASCGRTTPTATPFAPSLGPTAGEGRASRSSTRAPTRTARPTTPRRSPSSSRRTARSSTPSRSRPTSPPSGSRRPSRDTRGMVKIAQIAKTGLFPSQVEASGALGYNLASNVYWHPTLPVQLAAPGSHLDAARRRLREGHRPPVEPAAGRDGLSAGPRRRRAQGEQQPEGQGCAREGALDAEGKHDRRSPRLDGRTPRIPLAVASRTSSRRRSRAASG